MKRPRASLPRKVRRRRLVVGLRVRRRARRAVQVLARMWKTVGWVGAEVMAGWVCVPHCVHRCVVVCCGLGGLDSMRALEVPLASNSCSTFAMPLLASYSPDLTLRRLCAMRAMASASSGRSARGGWLTRAPTGVPTLATRSSVSSSRPRARSVRSRFGRW